MSEHMVILVLFVGLLEEHGKGLSSFDSKLGVRQIQGNQGWDKRSDVGDCL